MLDTLLQKFSTPGRRAIKQALNLATHYTAGAVHVGHLLCALSEQRGSIGAELLVKAGGHPLKFKQHITSAAQRNGKPVRFQFSQPAKRVLQKAVLLAYTNRHRYVGTEHLLAAILQTPDARTQALWQELGIDTATLIQATEAALRSCGKFTDLVATLNTLPQRQTQEATPWRADQAMQSQSMLEQFALELTHPDMQDDIDPLIGRTAELERLVQVISRRHKNNPVLIGDPGVGKTAIVEGLAKKIVAGDVPEYLRDKKVFALDMAALVAGTSFRGEFEQRFKLLLNEIKQRPEVILFIDELHAIMGAGSATGSMDAATILKPALARGDIHCIGATTFEDYKKHIESDAALSRRFQPITVHQPSVDQAIDIIRGVKKNYELFHRVSIDDGAIRAAVQLSQRYIPDRLLPDKALDIIDETAAAINVRRSDDRAFVTIKKLERALHVATEKKATSLRNEQFRSALAYHLQQQKVSQTLTQLKEQRTTEQLQSLPTMTAQHVATTVAAITGIPVHTMLEHEQQRLQRLEGALNKRVLGQSAATKAVAQAIRRSRTGIAPVNRPIGSFIFLGPSGVGKTELARVLAEEVFGTKDALIKIDMSEFSEQFTISKLLGAPAGYVGYREPSRLTDAVKQRPYAVVLFDEIEKAHPSIHNILLQLLEEGCITDGTGKKINFRNTIIVLTSNIGSEAFNQAATIGFSTNEETQVRQQFSIVQRDVLAKLKKQLSPELLDRLDHTIVFEPLSMDTLIAITRLQLKQLQQRLREKNISLRITANIAQHIAAISARQDNGARGIQRTIQTHLEDVLANKIITQARYPQHLTVKYVNQRISV